MPRGGWETLCLLCAALARFPGLSSMLGCTLPSVQLASKNKRSWHSGCFRLLGLTFIHACRKVISKLFFIQLLSAIYNTVYKQVSDLVSNLYLKINIIDSEF